MTPAPRRAPDCLPALRVAARHLGEALLLCALTAAGVALLRPAAPVYPRARPLGGGFDVELGSRNT